MGCCSQTIAGKLTIRQKDIDSGLLIRLRFSGDHNVSFEGSFTGRRYSCSGQHGIVEVDPRDASVLLMDRRFKVVGLKSGLNDKIWDDQRPA